MRIHICIPIHNRLALTARCIESLHRQTDQNISILVCDGGSTDGTAEHLAKHYPSVILLKGHGELWWTGAINRCMAYVLKHAGDEDKILLLNNDTELPEDYLANLADACRKFPNDVITSVVADIRDGRIVDVGYRQSWVAAAAIPVNPACGTLEGHPDMIEVTHASGRGTAYPLRVLRKIGIADEKRLPHYGADYDLSMRARRAGSSVYVCLNARVLSHIEETGLVRVHRQKGFKAFKEYFFSRRSPANLQARFWFAWKNCPRPLLPIYVFMDLFRLVGSYTRARIMP